MTKTQLGQLIARIIAAEWHAGALALSAEELAQAAPLLLNLGGAAWGWRQIRNTNLKDTPLAHELQQAYRLHTLHVAVKEMEIAQVFAHLRSQGLEPLMGKGWVIARQYPEPGLRPFGDIDLYVRTEEFARYKNALQQPGAKSWVVDLHNGAAELNDRSFDDLYAHSRILTLNGVAARTFGPEDHLRLLCLHFLREGAMRPLWLCDIAVAVNTLPADFDWDYFLSADQRRADWTICTIGLAHHLLGVRIEGLPIARRAMNLPRWLVPTTLKVWGEGKVPHGRRKLMAAFLRNPAGVVAALRERWPNAIEATVGTKGPFNNWPRLPFQLGECILRTTAFARQMPKLISKSS